MSYVPIVASLEDVQSIPGADRVASATARGYRLVVGSDRKAGDLGVVFPAGPRRRWYRPNIKLPRTRAED